MERLSLGFFQSLFSIKDLRILSKKSVVISVIHSLTPFSNYQDQDLKDGKQMFFF